MNVSARNWNSTPCAASASVPSRPTSSVTTLNAPASRKNDAPEASPSRACAVNGGATDVAVGHDAVAPPLGEDPRDVERHAEAEAGEHDHARPARSRRPRGRDRPNTSEHEVQPEVGGVAEQDRDERDARAVQRFEQRRRGVVGGDERQRAGDDAGDPRRAGGEFRASGRWRGRAARRTAAPRRGSRRTRGRSRDRAARSGPPRRRCPRRSRARPAPARPSAGRWSCRRGCR